MEGRNIVEERTPNDREVLLTIEDKTLNTRVKSPERYSCSCLWAEVK